MPADLLGRAIERFTRSPEARARPGAGLGLTLVEQTVTRHDGELRLCFRGIHVSHGRPAPVTCDHPESMTVAVLLPAEAAPSADGGRPSEIPSLGDPKRRVRGAQ